MCIRDSRSAAETVKDGAATPADQKTERAEESGAVKSVDDTEAGSSVGSAPKSTPARATPAPDAGPDGGTESGKSA